MESEAIDRAVVDGAVASEEELRVLSDGHVVAHRIEEVVDFAVSIEEEMMLEAAIIEDLEEH